MDAAQSRERLATTSILIIDDCKLQRETLSAILVNAGAVNPAMGWDFASVVEASGARAVDVVLLSVSTRDKLALLRAVRDTCPQAKVVIVGVAEDNDSEIIACAEAGAVGYHLRSESLFELLSLISRVADGESACSPVISAVLLRHLSALGSGRRTGPVDLNLTTREMQILQMLEMGLSNRDIADQLFIALHTVKNHVHAVLSKLGVNTRAEAAAYFRSLH
jgi:DNA-binding NarL/FixJ family response regulator